MDTHDPIKKPIGIRILRGLLVGFGLLLLNLIFVLGPYIGVWSVIIAAVASGFAFVLSGLALMTSYLLPVTITVPVLLADHHTLLMLSGGFLVGLGGMLMTLFVWLAKYLCLGTGKYVMWHATMIRGDEYE